MKQYLLPDYFSGGTELPLDEKETHYLKNVLRVKVGTELDAIDHSGKSWIATISRYENSLCYLSLVPAGFSSSEKKEGTELILCQSLIRGKNMDLIVRQAVEAGVTSVIPVETEFSQIRLKDFRNEKPERWQRIIKEAMQQSGSQIFTEAGDMVRIIDLPSAQDGEVRLFFHTSALDKNKIREILSDNPRRVYIFIGPEGGLSEKDIVQLKAKGFVPVFLGDNVLRAETAAIYAVATVKALLTF